MSSEGLKQYWAEVREIADRDGISVSEARRIWREEKDGVTRPDIDVAVKAILDREDVDESVVCPYCRDGFAPQDRVKTCEGCQTRLHADCAVEVRRCPTMGCRRQFSRQRASQSPAPVVRPSRIEIRPSQVRRQTFFERHDVRRRLGQVLEQTFAYWAFGLMVLAGMLLAYFIVWLIS